MTAIAIREAIKETSKRNEVEKFLSRVVGIKENEKTEVTPSVVPIPNKDACLLTLLVRNVKDFGGIPKKTCVLLVTMTEEGQIQAETVVSTEWLVQSFGSGSIEEIEPASGLYQVNLRHIKLPTKKGEIRKDELCAYKFSVA